MVETMHQGLTATSSAVDVVAAARVVPVFLQWCCPSIAITRQRVIAPWSRQSPLPSITSIALPLQEAESKGRLG
jgi:hypothetical protein